MVSFCVLFSEEIDGDGILVLLFIILFLQYDFHWSLTKNNVATLKWGLADFPE